MGNVTDNTTLKLFFKKLEAETDPECAIKVLDELFGFDLTKDQVISSQLGVLVNNLRKKGLGDGVTKACERVLLKWKPLMLSTASSVTPTAKRPVSTEAESDEKGDHTKRKKENIISDQQMVAKEVSKEEYQEVIKPYLTNNEFRDKSIEMFIRALMVDILPSPSPTGNEEDGSDKKERFFGPDDITCSVAHAIEGSLYNRHDCEVSREYKADVRAKYMNLSHKANGKHLRFGLLSEAITPPKFCSMTPQVFLQTPSLIFI